MSEKNVLQVSFADSAAENAFVLLEFDRVLCLDDSGNVKSRFEVGEPIYIAVNHEERVRVKEIKPTLKATITRMSDAVRRNTQQFSFSSLTENEKSLAHIPDGGVEGVAWYGNESEIVQDGQKIFANPGFCIGDVTYSYKVSLFKVEITEELDLGPDEEFPAIFFVVMESVS